MNAHAYLRSVTHLAHVELDARLSGFDLGKPADYTRFLTTQAAAFLPIEQALDEAGAAALVPNWTERRRGQSLRDDLAALAAATPPAIAAPCFTDPAEILGGVYVLEGSRLGGSILSRSIAPGLPQRFLTGSVIRGGWKSLILLLEHNLPSVVQRERAGNSAIMTFDCFFRAAMSVVEAR